MSSHLRSLGLLTALTYLVGVQSCAATANPDRSSLPAPTRVASEPPPAPAAPVTSAPSAPDLAAELEATLDNQGAVAAAPAPASPTPVAAQPASRAATGPATGPAAPSDDPRSPATAAPAIPNLGRVGDEGLPVAEFLRRLWLHDNSTARDVVEQMVFARMVLFEADRFRVQLAPARVDAEVKDAIASVEKRLADKGAPLTFDEHVRRNLELDPKLYRLSLRNDAIVSLLAERCVRAWALESGVCQVRISEFRDAQKLASARADLAAGKSFEEVAAAYGLGEQEGQGVTAMPIVRAENQELSRVAFATDVGQVGGPLEQSGAWLLIRVDSREDGRDVTWSADGPAIESSLVATPVHNMEYVQWRAAMTRRYQLDLSPFLELVGGGKP